MEDIVANALAVDSDDTTNAEKVLGRDSNAVKSTVFPEWKKIGALLANEDRGPSLVCCAHHPPLPPQYSACSLTADHSRR